MNSLALISQVEPQGLDEAVKDENWIEVMQEELYQFAVWKFFFRPQENPIISVKWVLKNKMDYKGDVIKDKARLVAWGYF